MKPFQKQGPGLSYCPQSLWDEDVSGTCMINEWVDFVDKEADVEKGKTGCEHEII